MKVDSNLSASLEEIPEIIRRLEQQGYDGVGVLGLLVQPVVQRAEAEQGATWLGLGLGLGLG